MTSEEMQRVLGGILRPHSSLYDPPTEADWDRLHAKFGVTFSSDFMLFIALMSRFQFPGEILNVASGRTNGNDSIELAFDFETEHANWNSEKIPFYAIGNGDYFCMDRRECPDSRVYYFYHDKLTFEIYASSFETWVQQLPQFLM